MEKIEHDLARWRASLVTSIPIGGLLSRNPVAYKWKAPFRCWLLREAALWRVTDLLTQSMLLHTRKHGLGARILLRSALETLASLIYLNLKIQAVVDGRVDFTEFSDLTSRLALGSKISPDSPIAVNVLTMLDHGEARYPGLRALYNSLSESAHPNFEGLVWGFSKVNQSEFETNFSDRWMVLYGGRHVGAMEFCMQAFEHEYNDVWAEILEELERWLVENDEKLEPS